MPAYQTTPFKNSPALLVAGTNQYVWGSYSDRISPTQGNVISNSAVTTTGTLTFQVISGNIPKVNDKITVVGTANSTGVFNVTNATILTVSTPDNGVSGVVTVTYAISSSSQGTTADTGQVEVPQSEIGESFVNGASVPVAATFNNALVGQQRTVTATVTFPTAPQQGSVFLQGAMFDIDAQYETLALVAGVGSVNVGPSVEVADLAYRFYRLNNVGAVGAGTVVGKIAA